MAYKSKESQREYHKKWYEKNKERRIKINSVWQKSVSKKVKEYKKTLSCTDCGYSGYDHPQVLDFDHLSDKKFQIAEARGKSFELIMSEIKKCDVVCANCHRIRTEKRRKIPE